MNAFIAVTSHLLFGSGPPQPTIDPMTRQKCGKHGGLHHKPEHRAGLVQFMTEYQNGGVAH
jgi:hypothetical protein